jgi:hypothetical protein
MTDRTNVDIAEPLKRVIGELVFNNVMLTAQFQAAQKRIEELEKAAPAEESEEE